MKPRMLPPSGTTAVLAAVGRFVATLDDDQAAQLHQPYSPRTVRAWSNLPQATLGRRHRRAGLSTGTLSPHQWDALHELLRAAAGSGAGLGADRIAAHLDADDYLLDIGGRYGYGRGQFVVAFLGAPGSTGRWQLQFGGHHLALAHTYLDGRLVGATPSFRGIEPFSGFESPAGHRDPERASWQALVDVLGALGPGQLESARLGGRHDDLVLGPGRDWAFPRRPEGLSASSLTGDQRSLLLAAMAGYVGDLADDDAERVLNGYASELDATRLGWSGSPGLTSAGDYVRIDGPSVWIELSMQDGINCAGPHPHAVWRDRHTDYGGLRF